MAVEIVIASGKYGWISQVFASEGKYRPKGGLGGGPTCPGYPRARPPWARPLAAWARGGPPPGDLLATGVFWNIRILGIFWEFSEQLHFWTFSALQRQNRQKLALGSILVG